jgi:acyl carrier protein
MLEGMVAAGFDTFVEVGPGQVVSALVRQVAGERAVAVALDGKAGGLSGFLSGVGALCVAGHGLDVARLYEGQPAPPEPVAPSRHAVMICGANYGRPYPPAGGAAGRHAPNPEPASKPVPIAAPAMPAPEPVFLSPQNETDPMTHPASMNDTAALAQLHADLAQRHSEFLQIMSAAHQHYVSTVAGMVQGQGGVVAPMIASAPAPVLTPVAVRAEPEPKPQPQPQPARVAETVVMKAASAPIIVAPAAAAPVAAPKAAPVQVASTPARAVVAAPVAQPVVAKPAGGGKAQALVTAIVAEKTGYPEDMLDPDMDLEAELGVDSIKQVEILSTLRERMPELPEIAPERLGELRSIGAIAAFLGGGAGAQPVTPAAPVKAVAPAPAPVAKPGHGNGNGAGNGHAKGGQREAMTALVRALIAEKTGYPQDMLEDDMDLESELGVDSIKQVEILSALREQRPDLPDVEPGQMAELRSIGKIAGFFA